MSGQRTQSSGGDAASVAAGCGVREIGRTRRTPAGPNDDGLAVFSWGRGEDGQLGLGDTRYVNIVCVSLPIFCSSISVILHSIVLRMPSSLRGHSCFQ
jgi:hypothetical protein